VVENIRPLPAVFGDVPAAAAAVAVAVAAAAPKGGVVVKKDVPSLDSVQVGPDTNSVSLHDHGRVAWGGPQRPSLDSVLVRPGRICSQNIRRVAFNSRDEGSQCVEGHFVSNFARP
jgi:hypothetical protein